MKTKQNFRTTRSSLETTFTRPCTGSQKTEREHERCRGTSPGLSSRNRDRVLISPFVRDPLVNRESPEGRTSREALAEAPLQRNKGTLNVNIPIVVEQMSKVLRDHYNLHPSIEHLKLSKIVQNHIPLGARLKHFVSNWEKITRDSTILGALKGYKIEFLKTPSQKFVPVKNYSEKEYQILYTEIQAMLQKKSGRDCRPKERMSKSVHKHFICTPQKRWGVSSHFQSKTTKRVCYLRTLQDGRFSGGQEHDDQERFHVQNRSKGCILLYSDTSDSQEIPQVQLGGSTPTVYKSSIRISSRSSSVHENHETYHSIPAQNGDSAYNLSARHFTSESKQRRVDEGQRFPYLVITQPGVVDKLEEISATAQTNNRISGSES